MNRRSFLSLIGAAPVAMAAAPLAAAGQVVGARFVLAPVVGAVEGLRARKWTPVAFYESEDDWWVPGDKIVELLREMGWSADPSDDPAPHGRDPAQADVAALREVAA